MRTKRSSGLRYTFLLFLLLSGCDRMICDDQEVARVTSPTGSLDAIVSVRDCGATTSWVTAESLASHDEPLSKAARIVTLDSDHGQVGLGEKNEIPVQMTWPDNHTLALSFPPKTRFFGFDSEVWGVRIERIP